MAWPVNSESCVRAGGGKPGPEGEAARAGARRLEVHRQRMTSPEAPRPAKPSHDPLHATPQ